MDASRKDSQVSQAPGTSWDEFCDEVQLFVNSLPTSPAPLALLDESSSLPVPDEFDFLASLDLDTFVPAFGEYYEA